MKMLHKTAKSGNSQQALQDLQRGGVGHSAPSGLEFGSNPEILTSRTNPDMELTQKEQLERETAGDTEDAPPFEKADFSEEWERPSTELDADSEGPSVQDVSEVPDYDADFEETAQLSYTERVENGMGTLALERVVVERAADPGVVSSVRGDFSQMTDAEIMLRAGAGDDTCFDYLAAKYRRPIISFMYRMVHNQAIAEELSQEVFLRVYRARQSYRAEARFTTWLYRIASNMAINHARDTKFERASSSVYLDQADEETGTTPDVADLRPLIEHDMVRDERMSHIRKQVLALPERQRMAVVMHKYQDMDYKQIGAVLKLSESATKSLLFRAYQTLREKLKEFA